VVDPAMRADICTSTSAEGYGVECMAHLQVITENTGRENRDRKEITASTRRSRKFSDCLVVIFLQRLSTIAATR
jgi:hypothetical protein